MSMSHIRTRSLTRLTSLTRTPSLTCTLATVAATAASVATAGLALAPQAQATPTASGPQVSASATAAQQTVSTKTGWMAVVTDAHGRGARTVELVSPAGVRQKVLTITANESLLDVSNDARRILTLDNSGVNPIYRVHDLATHKTFAIVAGGLGGVRFTNPTGTALLAQTSSETSSTGYWNVVRMSFDGRIQTEFPGTIGGSYLPSLDGRFLYATDAQHHVTVSNNATGAKLRTLAMPKGFSMCTPTRNVSATTFTAVCSTGSTSQVFRFAATGGAPVSLTGNLPRRPLGYTDYVATPGATVVDEGVGCGTGSLDKVSGRTVSRYGFNTIGSALDIVGNHAYLMRTGGDCDARATEILSASLVTGRVATLYAPAPGRTIEGFSIVNPMD